MATATSTSGLDAGAAVRIDPVDRRRPGRALRSCGFAVLAGVLILPSACAAADDPTADGRLVFCLEPGQTENMVHAAEALGMVTAAANPDDVVDHGRTLSIAGWHEADRAEFDRTCGALVSAAQETAQAGAAQGGGDGVGTSILLLVAGAVVSLLSGSVKYGIDRRRLQAEQLDTSVGKFHESYAEYCHRRQNGEHPSGDDYGALRQEVVTRLREVLALHPGWRRAKAANALLADRLGPAALEEHSRRRPPDSGAVVRSAEEETVTALLPRFEADIAATVRRLRRPVRGLWADR